MACLVNSMERRHRLRMLETDRLILRNWTQADWSQTAAILGDPDVMEFSDFGTLSSEQQMDWFRKACAARVGDILSGPLAIIQKTTSEIVGYIKLSNDPTRNEQGDLEIGFRLSRSAWGKGFASEAVAKLIEKANEIPSFTRVVAIVDPHNKRSIRVLEKSGMSRVSEIIFDGYDYPDELYALKLRAP